MLTDYRHRTPTPYSVSISDLRILQKESAQGITARWSVSDPYLNRYEYEVPGLNSRIILDCPVHYSVLLLR